eukprot:COSAG02_NODE_2017_length_10096_cov_52.537061_1_plen_32_part_00
MRQSILGTATLDLESSRFVTPPEMGLAQTGG